MQRIAERDASALELLYDRYERAVYSFAYRFVGDPMAAEETVQEHFLRIWNKAERFDASQEVAGAATYAHTRSQCGPRGTGAGHENGRGRQAEPGNARYCCTRSGDHRDR